MSSHFSRYVKALNATTGDLLWSYQPDMPIWNFLALFPDESSLVFQVRADGADRAGFPSPSARSTGEVFSRGYHGLPKLMATMKIGIGTQHDQRLHTSEA